MTKQKVWRNILPLALMGLLITGGFSCNLIGPHSPSGPDTTSSNFTFQTYTFGGNAGGCLLNDVSIVNDTDIWAVGAIYLDSADGNPDLSPYNAVHWNGKAWTLLRIPYIYQGQPFYHPISAVFALSPDDVWFGGNGMEHWDGQKFSDIEAVNAFWFGELMTSIWASSDNNIYVVGSGGTAAHFGGSWQALNTGTTTDINLHTRQWHKRHTRSGRIRIHRSLERRALGNISPVNGRAIHKSSHEGKHDRCRR